MTKLQVILDGQLVGEHQLTRNRTTIGRRRHSDILLDNRAVSGDHALIERVGTDFYLEDRASTNGTRLNGKAVSRQRLCPGDEITIARYLLRCSEENDAAPVEFEKTVLMTEVRPGGSRVDTHAKLEPATPALPVDLPQVGVLRVVGGADIGRELKLTKTLTTLGKPGNQVVVVTRRPQGYYVTQVEGTQPPRVNGRPMRPGPHLLAAGDRIELMAVQLEFALQPAEPGE